MNALLFLLLPFAACLVLTGIHTYLGLHVIRRGVIFVDIALAQLAALGFSVALLSGFELEELPSYFFALGFASLGALFFAFYRNRRIPDEALIGVVFAVSSALTILIADRIPHGGEHLKFVLNGNILWVNAGVLTKTAFIYLALGLIHFKMRNKMILVSTDPERAKKQGIKIRLWDLFFYLTFGIVITSSVQIAGILLVFSFLIVPALIGILFCNAFRKQLLLGWGIGGLVSLGGMAFSYTADLPTGSAIVACFGLALALSFLIKKLAFKV